MLMVEDGCKSKRSRRWAKEEQCLPPTSNQFVVMVVVWFRALSGT